MSIIRNCYIWHEYYYELKSIYEHFSEGVQHPCCSCGFISSSIVICPCVVVGFCIDLSFLGYAGYLLLLLLNQCRAVH